MGSLEQKLLAKAPHKSLIWWRYIDDIWTDGRDKLQEFIALLNQQHPTIKFTSEISSTSVSFLAFMITNTNGKLSTDLYPRGALYIRKDGGETQSKQKFSTPKK